MSARYPFTILVDGVTKSGSLSWKDLQEQTDFRDNIFHFTRTAECQGQYDSYLKETADLGAAALHNRIVKTNLDIDNSESFGESGIYTFRKNTFPYDFGKNAHFLLWIHPDCHEKTKKQFFDKEYINETVTSLIVRHRSALGNLYGKERLIFRNASINKSVRSIEHFHVIFKFEDA